MTSHHEKGLRQRSLDCEPPRCCLRPPSNQAPRMHWLPCFLFLQFHLQSGLGAIDSTEPAKPKQSAQQRPHQVLIWSLEWLDVPSSSLLLRTRRRPPRGLASTGHNNAPPCQLAVMVGLGKIMHNNVRRTVKVQSFISSQTTVLVVSMNRASNPPSM